MADKTILVTGASGFTGRYFIDAANQHGYRCVALCQPGSQPPSGADGYVVADLLNAEALDKAVAAARPDKVVHLAAVSFVAHDNVSEIYQTNLVGTLNLLSAIRKHAPAIERILLVSSANIYGNSTQLPITEDTPANPANHYGVSKYAMEMAAEKVDTLPIVTVRPFNYTGVGQSPNFLIPKIVGAYQRNDKHIELGNLDISRDFSDVRDVVRAYVRLLGCDSTANLFNVCSGQPTSLRSIVSMLNRLAGYEIEIRTNPEFVRLDDIKTLYGSPQRLEEFIGTYRQFVLNDTLSWLLRNRGAA